MMRASLSLAILVLVSASAAAAELPTTLDLTVIRGLPVQHDGRWPPLDTVARDIVESVTGDASYRGHDPVLLLLAWTFDAWSWTDEPLLSIDNAELRAELRLPASKTAYSYAELLEHHHLRGLIDDLANIAGGRKPNPLETKVGDISEKLILLQEVFNGNVIRPIPDPDNIVGVWHPIESTPDELDPDPVRGAWAELGLAFLMDDAPAFAAASRRLVESLAALPAAHRTDPGLIATELRYNRLRPFRTAWIVMVVGAVLAAGALLVRRKWFDGLAIIVMLAGFAILTYGLSLRWQIAGRIPAANMYESLLFLSWGMGAFAIVAMFIQRQRVVPLTASGMGALTLILADCLPLDHYIRPIMPVLLDTVWMSIHVPIIMVSYSVLALAVVIAHVQLVVMATAPRRRDLANVIDSLHYWYVHVGSLLLLAGIITGSMWAASSWGRYWGWDPKEVWSLVAFLGYLAILHVRINRARVAWWMYVVGALLGVGLAVVVVPKLGPLTAAKQLALCGAAVAMLIFVLPRGRFATALKSVLAFWLIVMTYVGVNYLLGIGLHSYGFGTGAVARYMFLIGGIDLVLIAVCCAVYAARYPWHAAAANRAAE
ncbi:MAG: cytochrome c biogenesis protein CcsA [Phycisphaerae bacterium]|nr:cytochrome c biogenesis protein CcsA [Phycisphaerae bacterium]